MFYKKPPLPTRFLPSRRNTAMVKIESKLFSGYDHDRPTSLKGHGDGGLYAETRAGL